FQANYTYSKTIDLAAYSTSAFTDGVNDYRCIPCNRSTSLLSVPHVFIANFIYETPGLKGSNAIARGALGGWQLSGIYRAQSGAPFTILSGTTTSWDNRGRDYPDYASDDHVVHTHPGNLTNYLDASDFVAAPQGTKGNVGRTPAYGPGVNTWDLGLSKSFRFAERYKVQFRWEMFNAFNRATFNLPNANYSSSAFGLINSTNPGYPPRVMQAALKFYF
ncbi:MAG TPA: hypothetical protein VH088_17820, partial [Terriglobales bacterium]|nr:hypothetical protein [Terriglobales bacterium]